MMKRILILPILLFGMLFLVACNGAETQTGPGNGAFLGGTQGVLAEFEAFGVEEDGIYSLFDTL